MSLPAHSRLGPYEIVGAIGAGGMGEVYRATDTKLGRDVAIKVLPAEVAADPERLARFEREARLLASLNHSNIAHVYGFETARLDDGSAAYFLAMELVPGEDVAERLKRGPVPVEDAVEIAKQIAEALEEAHEKGIVHRDLKPANVKLTPDGKVKVLDFGLAKAYAGELASGAASDLSQSPTLAHKGTQAGVILGTAAYMSPEQARGKPVDKRADIWAFGVVFFEMLTGRKLFEGETVSDTLAAVLRQDLDWTRLPPATPASLRALLQRCLERDPRQRLHDIADARIELEQPASATVLTLPPPRRSPVKRFIPLLTVGGLALALGYLAGWQAGTARKSPAASFQRMTFQRGHFTNARFAPDGETVLYAAAWEGQPLEVFQARPGGGELPLGIKGADVLSISRSGEMAILLPRVAGQNQYVRRGTLARVPVSGGTPRELVGDVAFADWTPDGGSLAVIREVAGRLRLELPPGQVLYEPKGHIVSLRVSPRGDRVAFFEREGQSSWSLVSVDRGGRGQTLSGGWFDWWDLAWSPSGDEVWFGGNKAGFATSIYAVDLHGRQRALVQSPGTLTILDVSPAGRALVSRVSAAHFLMSRPRGAPGERRLSRLEGSSLADLSADGTVLLLKDESEALAGRSVSLGDIDGKPAVQLGEGAALSLSADGKWALGLRTRDSRLLAYPTGPGEPRVLAADLDEIVAARFLPDGKGVLVTARTDAAHMGLFNASPDGGPARPVVSRVSFALFEMGRVGPSLAVSPDGRFAAMVDGARKLLVVSLHSGEIRAVEGVDVSERPAQWTPDGRQLYVYRLGEIPARVFKVDVVTGARELWREIAPPDTAGVSGINSFRVTPDGSAYAYSYEQYLSELYAVEGLR